jgi:hypothetical protein
MCEIIFEYLSIHRYLFKNAFLWVEILLMKEQFVKLLDNTF